MKKASSQKPLTRLYQFIMMYFILLFLKQDWGALLLDRAIISPQFLIKGDSYVGVKENTKIKKDSVSRHDEK